MYLMYFSLWVIFNGNFTLEICLFGVVIAAAVFAFTCKFMGHSLQKEKRIYQNSFRMLSYICLLIKEIIKANFVVIHMILSEREEVEPTLVSFHSRMKTGLGKTLFANAITLTPGTITVKLEDSNYVVHCLDKTLALGINSSELESRLEAMESGVKPETITSEDKKEGL